MSKFRFTHFPPILSLLLAVLLVGLGYQWGRTSQTSSLGQFVGQIKNSTSSSPSGQPDLGLLSEAWQVVHDRFLREPDDTKLVEGSIGGMVTALGDPYTVYLDAQAAKELSEGLSGYFSGIGAEISVKDGRLLIVSPLPDSPADRAGLKPQDEILSIDDKAVVDMTFSDAIRAIRGKEGTTVRLSILREGIDQPKEVTVARENITVKSVETETLDGQIGVIRITAFHDDTTRLTREALEQFTKAGVKGFILDLRSNPGGLLQEGVEVADLFLSDGVIVKQRDRGGETRDFEATPDELAGDLPLVVLIDKGSASAAEIVAGALSDHKRGILVGQTSYGKGTVQELDNLSNGGQLKVTVAEWLTPNDQLIDGKGITPEKVVDLTEEDEAADRDPQRNVAISILKDRLKN